MNYMLSMAFKNIFRQKKRSFTLGINYLVVSILLLLLFSFSDGVKTNITANIVTANSGHLTMSGETVIKGKTYTGISGANEAVRALQETFGPDTRVLKRYSVASALYYQGKSKRLSFVGIEVGKDTNLTDQIQVVEGSWDAFAAEPGAVIMYRDLADFYGLKIGDEVVISTRSRFGAFNTGTIRIAGIYGTGNFFAQNLVISHFDFVRTLDLGDEGAASQLYVYFPEMKDLDARRTQARAALETVGFKTSEPASDNEALAVVASASPQYKLLGEDVNEKRLTIATVDEVLGIVGSVLSAVNALGGFIAAILFFIIAVSLFINLRMTINDRMQEIGTLRAIGAEAGTVTSLFLLESILLGLMFTLLGLGIGLGIVGFVSTVPTFPADGWLGLFLNRGKFVLSPTAGSLMLIVGITGVFTTFFSFFPARYGGRIPAVVALSKTH